MHLIPNESRRPGVYPPPPVVRFPVWRTIKLGTHKTVMELAKAALDVDRMIIGKALDMMAQPAFTVAARETQVDLAAVSVSELGFPSGAPRQWVYEKARQLGLRLCPSEVGPQLLRQHPGKGEGLFLRIAMDPIVHPQEGPSGFLLTNTGGEIEPWLLWLPIDPGGLVPPGARFAYVLPCQHRYGRH